MGTIMSIVAIVMAVIAFLGMIATYFGFITKIMTAIGNLKADIAKIAGKCSSIDYDEISDLKEKLITCTTTLENVDLPYMLQRLVTIETLVSSHGDVSLRLATIESKMDMFWTAVEPALKEMLHHPITPEKDSLLEQFPFLSDDEMCRLKLLLKDEENGLKNNNDPKYKQLILAYSLMALLIDNRLEERKINCKSEEVK